jgi:hypothetical protein
MGPFCQASVPKKVNRYSRGLQSWNDRWVKRRWYAKVIPSPQLTQQRRRNAQNPFQLKKNKARMAPICMGPNTRMLSHLNRVGFKRFGGGDSANVFIVRTIGTYARIFVKPNLLVECPSVDNRSNPEDTDAVMAIFKEV